MAVAVVVVEEQDVLLLGPDDLVGAELPFDKVKEGMDKKLMLMKKANYKKKEFFPYFALPHSKD